MVPIAIVSPSTSFSFTSTIFLSVAYSYSVIGPPSAGTRFILVSSSAYPAASTSKFLALDAGSGYAYFVVTFAFAFAV